MVNKRRTALSPLALVVLALLDEAPMYPYRMQQLIRERGNDQVINVRHRASLYQTIARLERDGLLKVHGTARSENRPERTVYQLTGVGRKTLHSWLREMLSTPAPEFPEFPAALSFLYLLTPTAARKELSRRTNALEARHRVLSEMLQEHRDSVPQLFLLESDCMKTALESELTWVHGVIADLDAGRLTWDIAAIRAAQAHSS